MTPEIHNLLVQVGIYIEPRRPYEHWHTDAPSEYLESDYDFLVENNDAVIELLENGGLERLVALVRQKQRNQT